MFTVKAQKNSVTAKTYFSEHLSLNDYYAEDAKCKIGTWVGKGASSLGLKIGEAVTQGHFQKLCNNISPLTGEKITPIDREGRRVFYDFTCSAPKSFSIMAMIDPRLNGLHQEAADVAMAELEVMAATRIRKDKQSEDLTTGNIVAACFLHTTSRSGDPNLHTHFPVFNMTFNPVENCWKALQAKYMYEATPFVTATYRNELAKRLLKIGYKLRTTKNGFEIDGVSEKLIQQFSKRSAQRDTLVKKKEQKLGRKLSHNEVSIIIHQSRPAKITDVSDADVIKRQLSELSVIDRHKLESLKVMTAPIKIEEVDINQAKKQGLDHLTERRSVVNLNEIYEAVLKLNCGKIDLSKLKIAVESDPDLIHVGKEYTTRDILREELRLISLVKKGQNTVAPLAPHFSLAPQLGKDQLETVQLVLNSKDQVTGIRGLAGTGKSTSLKELNNAVTQTGWKPIFCAPTASAVDMLIADKFRGAITLARLLMYESLPKGTVVVLDEAGLVGTKDMLALLEMANRSEARVILVGDTNQHTSVARGDALLVLQDYAELKSGTLSKIRRQKPEKLRQAVELASKQQTGKAFERLLQMKEIREVNELPALYQLAGKEFVDSVARGINCLMTSPTWAEIKAVTEAVREVMRERGQLGQVEHLMPVFDSFNWTEAEKSSTSRYQAGMRLHFVLESGSLAKGEFAEVMEVSKNTLILRKDSGQEVTFQPRRSAERFEVGESKKLPVAPGERLLLRANSGDLINGQLVEVREISNDGIILKDDRIIPPGYEMFTHGYAITSQASQGKTVDEVFLVASTRSLAAVSKKQFYVSISRARERVRVYTDDVDLLAMRVESTRTRKSAVELKSLRSLNRLKSLSANVSQEITSNPPAKKNQRAAISKRLSLVLKIINLAKAAKKWAVKVTTGVESAVSTLEVSSPQIAQNSASQIHRH